MNVNDMIKNLDGVIKAITQIEDDYYGLTQQECAIDLKEVRDCILEIQRDEMPKKTVIVCPSGLVVGEVPLTGITMDEFKDFTNCPICKSIQLQFSGIFGANRCSVRCMKCGWRKGD